jgi:Cu+-exporting ATPase
MEVIKIKVTGKYSADELLQLAASVEKESTHPLAWAIVRFAERKEIALIPTKDVKVVPGQGVSALINGREIKVGNSKFVSANSNEKAKLTVVYISVDNTVYGFIEFVDSIKKDAIAAINELKQRGIRCVMLTGDRSEVAESFGEIFGITEVHAEVLPGEKAGIISRYQDQGEIVAMVGDGINDAPALTQADVGIALGTGTDIAIESGDIVLVKGDLSGVVRAAVLAEATFKKIKQNLFWAFIYNVIALPLAFLGLLHPIIAEGAMALSSINVVGNSNRLRRKHLS